MSQNERVFHVELDTALNFDEAMEFLRKTVGLPANSPVLSLTYGGKTKVKLTDTILKDERKLTHFSEHYKRRKEMNIRPGDQQMVLRGPRGTKLESASFIYFYGRPIVSGVESSEELQQLTYQDSRYNAPTLNLFLQASPVKLNYTERVMLEEIIIRALSVDKAN